MRSSSESPRSLALLLPTLNEEQGLRATIRDLPLSELRSLGFKVTVLVIDGHSTDQTVNIARSHGATVLVQRSKGKGSAVREGLDWVVDARIPHAIVMDADFTYPGSSLPSLAMLLDAGSDFVIGIRRPDRHALSDLGGLVHRVGNGILNTLAGGLTRAPILDVCSGLWGVRTSILPTLDLVSEGFDIEAEAFIKAFRFRFAVSQVPVTYRDRVGDAKLHAVRDGSRILLSILRHSLRIPRSAAPQTGPREPTGGRIPESVLRDVQSVLLALNNQRVSITVSRDRAPAIDEMVDRLQNVRPGLIVERIARVDSNRGAAGLKDLAFASDSRRDAPSWSWSIVITLPNGRVARALDATSEVGASPEGDRLHLELTSPGSLESVVAPRRWSRSGGIRFERDSARPLSSLRMLSSNLAQFGAQRDLALIAANVAHSDYSVFRDLRHHEESAPAGLPDGQAVADSSGRTGMG